MGPQAAIAAAVPCVSGRVLSDLSRWNACGLARSLQAYSSMNTSVSGFRRLPALRAAGRVLAAALAVLPAVGFAGIEPLPAIRAAAENFVRARMPSEATGAQVSAGALDPRLRLASCAAPLDTALLGGERLGSQTTVAVGCHAGADWTIYVPVTVESRIQVFALRAAEPQGVRLKGADLVTETRLVAGLPAGYVTDVTEFSRSTLRHPLPAGAVLMTQDLLPDFLVRQGEQVTLVASLGGVKVRAAGVALQSGRYGALIQVQNVASAKVVQGVVADGRTVKVSP